MVALNNFFQSVQDSNLTLQEVRTKLRQDMNSHSSDKFPYGQVGANVVDAIEYIFNDTIFYTVPALPQSPKTVCVMAEHTDKSTKMCITKHIANIRPDVLSWLHPDLDCLPELIFVAIGDQQLTLTKRMKTSYGNTNKVYNIRVIIYFGNAHWTARLIDNSNDIWYYDSMRNNGQYKRDGKLLGTDQAVLRTAQGRKASVILYEASKKNANKPLGASN